VKTKIEIFSATKQGKEEYLEREGDKIVGRIEIVFTAGFFTFRL
jgi:hypothetical protein